MIGRITLRCARGSLGLLVALTMACGGDEAPPQTAVVPGTLETAGAAESDTAVVAGPNRAPTLERVRITPEHPTPGETVRVEVWANDPDGDPLHHRYSWRVDGRPVNVDGANLVLGRVGKGDSVEVSVTSSDGRLESDAKSVSVRVANRAPILTAVVLEPLGEVSVGEDVVAVPKALDHDGDPIRFNYVWAVNGSRVAVTGPQLPKSYLRRGDRLSLSVYATDGEDESNVIESSDIVVGNAAPVIVSRPPALGSDGTFVYPLEVLDPDGDRTLRFSLEEGPPGMQVDSFNGTVRWTPKAGERGTQNVVLAVDDLQGGIGRQRFTVTIDDGDSVPAARGE